MTSLRQITLLWELLPCCDNSPPELVRFAHVLETATVQQ
jgi:hypothetical protein